jgi:hypothetical protein
VVDLAGCGRGTAKLHRLLVVHSSVLVDKEPGMVHYQPGTPVSLLLLNPQGDNRSPGKCRTASRGAPQKPLSTKSAISSRMKSRCSVADRWQLRAMRSSSSSNSLRPTGRMGRRAGGTPGTPAGWGRFHVS